MELRSWMCGGYGGNGVEISEQGVGAVAIPGGGSSGLTVQVPTLCWSLRVCIGRPSWLSVSLECISFLFTVQHSNGGFIPLCLERPPVMQRFQIPGANQCSLGTSTV